MKISKKNIVKLFVVSLSSWNQGANPISACTSWPFLTDKGFDICDVKPNRVVGGKINDRLEACNLRPYCPCGNVTVFMRTILLTVLNLKVLFILVYLFTLSGDTPDTDLTQQRLFVFFDKNIQLYWHHKASVTVLQVVTQCYSWIVSTSSEETTHKIYDTEIAAAFLYFLPPSSDRFERERFLPQLGLCDQYVNKVEI